MVFQNFFNFFAIFFGIFYYASGRSGMERQFLFSLFLVLLQPILAWKEAIMGFFFYFLNFFTIFFELSLMCRVRTKRNDNFYFLFFGLFQSVLARNIAVMVFLNFSNYFAIFLEFSITRWVGTKQNDNFCFLSLSTFSNLFWLEKKP